MHKFLILTARAALHMILNHEMLLTMLKLCLSRVLLHLPKLPSMYFLHLSFDVPPIVM